MTLTVRLKNDHTVPFDALPIGAAFRVGNEAFVKIDHNGFSRSPTGLLANTFDVMNRRAVCMGKHTKVLPIDLTIEET